jgi:hypothetical protein
MAGAAAGSGRPFGGAAEGNSPPLLDEAGADAGDSPAGPRKIPIASERKRRRRRPTPKKIKARGADRMFICIPFCDE